ncbi:MAG: hypothetical protein JW902_10760, partial [Syntrophaceae bacterium]|nr:hypothetical protein [Syntrophaceae bacterium]
GHFDRRATEWPEVEKSIKKTDFSTPLNYARNESKSALIKLNWYYCTLSAIVRSAMPPRIMSQLINICL